MVRGRQISVDGSESRPLWPLRYYKRVSHYNKCLAFEIPLQPFKAYPHDSVSFMYPRTLRCTTREVRHWTCRFECVARGKCWNQLTWVSKTTGKNAMHELRTMSMLSTWCVQSTSMKFVPRWKWRRTMHQNRSHRKVESIISLTLTSSSNMTKPHWTIPNVFWKVPNVREALWMA